MAIQQAQIIQAAFRLLDADGVEGASLRKLACGLGIRAPSLYWHFPSKQALIDAMADALIEPVARDIPADASWREILRQVANELRHALKAHRDGARVYAGTYLATENILRIGEAVIGALANAGAEPRFAAATCMDLSYYVIGFVIEEQALPDNPGHIEKIRAALLALTQGRFPHCQNAAHLLTDPDFDQRFDQGLDVLLDGIERRLGKSDDND